ncbi:MAG: MFS transporter [Magnetospirillum sp.]|nr:MFS transporter [Magnetospirillum sp.]
MITIMRAWTPASRTPTGTCTSGWSTVIPIIPTSIIVMSTDHAASNDRPATRLATRLCFLAAGFAMACWAPLVPYAKARLGLDEASLGLLLLCLGIGSVTSMPLTGALVGRLGSRVVILAAGAGLCAALPGLALAGSMPVQALSLLLFGASLGAIDVAMNVHAVAVEKDAGVPLMSGFHGLFSVGCVAGAGTMASLLALGLTPGAATGIAVLAVLAALGMAAPRLLRHTSGGEASPLFVRPHGAVLLLGALAFVAFLTEGAILDWTALFLIETRGFAPWAGGIGFALFSLAMTAGRLTGDRVVAALGGRRVLLWGGLLAVAGFVVLVAAPWAILSLLGLVLMGLGASNLVPVLFSAAGRQQAMPVGLAVAAMTTIGYAGILAGPALIGFAAAAVGLPASFVMLAGLVLCIPLASRRVAA